MLGWGYSGAGPRRICRKRSRGRGAGEWGHWGSVEPPVPCRGGGAANGCDRARAAPRPRAPFPWGEPTVWGRAGGRCCAPVLLPPAGVVLAVRVAMGSTPFCRRRRMAFFFFTGFHGKLKHLHRFAERNIDESFLIILRFKFRYDKFFFRLLWITIESELLKQIREPILLKWTMIHPYCLKQTYKQIPKFIFETQRNCENGLS